MPPRRIACSPWRCSCFPVAHLRGVVQGGDRTEVLLAHDDAGVPGPDERLSQDVRVRLRECDMGLVLRRFGDHVDPGLDQFRGFRVPLGHDDHRLLLEGVLEFPDRRGLFGLLELENVQSRFRVFRPVLESGGGHARKAFSENPSGSRV